MVTHYPSSAISCTEVASNATQVSQVTTDDSRYECSDSATNDLKKVHISAQLMEDFLELARKNTDKDLETCGVLGASLKEEIFYATTLIIPKQESTSSSCQALKEEEIFNIQNDRSLLPVMVPEAIAIVVAPTDKTRNYGIFRLTDPSGMHILKECQEKGFHPHQDSDDGRPLYEQCSHVYINPNLRFEIFDLR